MLDAAVFALLTALLFLNADGLDYKVSDFAFCPEIPGKRAFLIDIHDRIVNDQQEFIGNATMHKDFGNDNTFFVEAYRVLRKKDVRLGVLKGKGSCNTMNLHGGTAWLKIATLAKIKDPSKCPVPKKNYFLGDYYPVAASEIPILKMVPKGKFKVKVMQNDSSTGNVEFCCTLIFERF